MKHLYKKSIALLLMFFMLSIPVVAKAQVYYNMKITLNGQTQSIQIPIQDSIKKTLTFRYTYTIKDGKWTLVSKTENPIVEKPKAPVISSDKQESPKEDTSSTKVKGLTADEQKMLDLVNSERKKAGLAPLKVDMRLVEISRMKSKDMIDKNYFSHTSPTYGSPFDMLKKSGISYSYAGENLAGSNDVERAHVNLMNSPGHRRNILNSNYTHVGIGIVKGGPYGKMYTQTFIGIK